MSIELQMQEDFNNKYGDRANKYWCEFGIAQWGSAIKDHGFEMLNQLEEKRAKRRKINASLFVAGFIIVLLVFGVLRSL